VKVSKEALTTRVLNNYVDVRGYISIFGTVFRSELLIRATDSVLVVHKDK